MGAKKERIVAYWVAGIFFVISVVCYAAFPEKSMEQPVRLMLHNAGGKVLFSHMVHTSEDGYGFACMDCHHELEAEGDVPSACGECHETESDVMVKRSDAFHAQCIGCHKDMGAGPEECAGCHML